MKSEDSSPEKSEFPDLSFKLDIHRLQALKLIDYAVDSTGGSVQHVMTFPGKGGRSWLASSKVGELCLHKMVRRF